MRRSEIYDASRLLFTSSLYHWNPTPQLRSQVARPALIPNRSSHLSKPRYFATLSNAPLRKTISHKPSSDATSSKLDLPALERHIYEQIQATNTSAPLSHIYQAYKSNAGRVLEEQLPYESRPNASRRARAEDDGVVLIAHVASGQNGACKVSLSSGFALASAEEKGEEQHVATCCHTLEEVARTTQLATLSYPNGIYVFQASGNPIPVSGVLSSLPRHDILLLSLPPTTPRIRTLPLSPYPAPADSPIATRLLSSPGRPEIHSKTGEGEWREWMGGHGLRKWATGGKVLGYRDLAGRESKTGTYDALSHMLFNILPTPGSSGAPLMDGYGAVVGMALGTRMDNRVEGNRGWGVPSELIFEMFTLPGLKLKSR